MDPRYHLRDTGSLPSPSLLFYREIIEGNLQRAVHLMNGDVTRLRPHVKTHKTVQIVRMESDLGITKHKCATLREAHMLAQAGAPDILVAYPIVGPNVTRLVELIIRYPGSRFMCLVDDQDAGTALGEAMASAGLSIEVLIDLDVGMHRTGIAPDERAIKLYQHLASLTGVVPIGLHAYDGHNRASNVAEREALCRQILRRVRSLREELEANGLAAGLLVMGGTPPFPFYARQPDVEPSPGTFVLHDCGYGSQLPDLGFTPAALLFSRVISRPQPHLATLDLGHKAIAADPPGDRGVILNVPGAKVRGQSEEHWVIELTDRTTHDTVKVGDVVFVCPTHICPSVALHQQAYVVDDGRVTDEWSIAARGRRL